MNELLCPKTLKYLTLEKIVSSHFCINELDNSYLNLPKILFRELVEIAPSLVKMPNLDYTNLNFWCHNIEKKLHQRLLNDHTYSKYFVVWLQSMQADVLAEYLPIVTHFLEINYIIEIDNVESIFLLCTKCFKLHLTIHPIDLNSERYRIKKKIIHKTYCSITLQRELKNKIQCKKSWCKSCKQVPLFQIANYALCEKIVGVSAHNCLEHFPIDEDSDDLIYCLNCYGSGIMTNFILNHDVNISMFS